MKFQEFRKECSFIFSPCVIFINQEPNLDLNNNYYLVAKECLGCCTFRLRFYDDYKEEKCI